MAPSHFSVHENPSDARGRRNAGGEEKTHETSHREETTTARVQAPPSSSTWVLTIQKLQRRNRVRLPNAAAAEVDTLVGQK